MVLHIRIHGVNELVAEMIEIQKKVDYATVAATKAAQREVVKNVRKNMRGAPRWGKRGRSRVYAESVNLGFTHHPRGGGPGKFTGMLYSGVGGKKRVVSIDGVVNGGVGVGGSRLRPNNFKKARLEARYPFFEPGVQASESAVGEKYAAAWRAAIERRGGL